MTARTDKSDPGRYSPAYATGRQFGESASRRFGRATEARTRTASSDCIVRTVSFGPDPLKIVKGLTLCAKRVYPIGGKGLTLRTKRVYPFALKGLPFVRWGLGAGALGVG